MEKKEDIPEIEATEPNGPELGFTLAGNITTSQIDRLIRLGAKWIQIVANFKKGTSTLDPGDFLEVVEYKNPDVKYIVHMPFWFHLLQPAEAKRRGCFQAIEKYWKELKLNYKVPLIVHCKGIHTHIIPTKKKMVKALSIYAPLCPSMKITLENDAGGKNNPAPRLSDLAWVVNSARTAGLDIGLCVDTEHAYAAGDRLFSVNYKKTVTMIHLNAVPPQVKFGGHLDQHSTTPIEKSKSNDGFALRVVRSVADGCPVILERTDLSVLLKDINWWRKSTK